MLMANKNPLGADCSWDAVIDKIHKDHRDSEWGKTVQSSKRTAKEVAEGIAIQEYLPASNSATLRQAQTLIDNNWNAAWERVMGDGEPTALTYATAQDMMRRLQNEGRYGEAIEIVERVSLKATKQGQAIQALSMWNRLTPEGALAYAQKVAKRNNKKIDPKEAKDIMDLASKVQKARKKNERALLAAKLKKRIQEVVAPPTIWEQIQTLHTMGQLLNPKTAVRNLTGNALFNAAETGSDVLAASIDVALSKITGKRTKVLPQLGSYGKGFKTGIKEGIRDARLGIDTNYANSKFDIPRRRVFKNKILRGLETALDMELRATDRAFYQAAYQESMINQLAAVNATKGRKGSLGSITPEMSAIAHHEALYRTFQDESTIALVLSKVKKTLNAISPQSIEKLKAGKTSIYDKDGIFDNDFGFGDFVIKYPKTPGNLLARAFDYSPVGFARAIYEGTRPFVVKGSAFDQRQFVQSFSRAVLGSGIIAMGYSLGHLGLATGQRLMDPDIGAVEDLEGKGEFRLNASGVMRFAMAGLNPEAARAQKNDIWVSYDWNQPMAGPFAAGVNISLSHRAKGVSASGAVGDTLMAVGKGADTLTEQGMLQGLRTLFTARDDEGNYSPTQGFIDVVSQAPSSFVPTFFSQVNQIADNRKRETSDPDPFKQSLNQAAAKIPLLSQTLPVKKNVYGEDAERYQDGSNNLFNVFINPSFTSALKNDPVGQEVLGIFERTGEKGQAPRVAAKTVKITKADGSTEKLELTGEQRSEYQRELGGNTRYIFNKLVGDKMFSMLSDEGKAKVMAWVVTDVNTATKASLFGHRPKKPGKQVLYLYRGNERAYFRSLRLKLLRSIREERRTG